MTESPDIKQLNSFLRGEIAAVETYRQALEKITNPTVKQELRVCQESHERRADLLRAYIRRMGGDPADSSGVWGGFAKLVEGGAKALGEKAAISALEEGEDHGRNDYRRDLSDLTPEARDFIAREVVPEQERTHRTMSQLQHAV